MVKKELIDTEDWAQITQLCKNAIKIMLGFEVCHVGINCMDTNHSEQSAKLFEQLFNLEYRSGNSSNFAGSGLEFTKSAYLGTHGHLAIGTWSVDRALYHLSEQGVTFKEDTRKTEPNGKTKSIYLDREIAGFAIHLLQK